MFRKESLILAVILLVKAILMVELILSSPIGLGPDEAQYWTWSQQIDWGYYSKPPGIAWQIWLGTQMFGNHVLGVRFFSVIIGCLLPILIYITAIRSGVSTKGACWGAIAFALAPMGVLSSFFAITDGGMLLFWTACLAYLAPFLMEQKTPNYAVVGFLIGCGALFKWPIYFLWVLIVAFWPFYRWMISFKILIGLVFSFLALLPSLYWNVGHEFATFRHVFSTVSGGHARAQGIFAGNPLEYIGSQFAIASPILGILICMALVKAWRRYREVPVAIQFFVWTTTAVLCGGFVLSLFMKIQGNWPIAAYPSGFVLLGWLIQESKSGIYRWTFAGIVLSVFLTSVVFMIPVLQSHAWGPHVPYKSNPFRHNIGWEQLEPALLRVGYRPDQDALLSDKYQTVSELSFYGPEQKLAHFFNLMGVRKNQFSYWPKMKENKGKCFFVVVENIPHLNESHLKERYLEQLAPYFGSIRFVETAPLFSAYGVFAKGALIFECEDFKGNYPVDPELY